MQSGRDRDLDGAIIGYRQHIINAIAKGTAINGEVKNIDRVYIFPAPPPSRDFLCFRRIYDSKVFSRKIAIVILNFFLERNNPGTLALLADFSCAFRHLCDKNVTRFGIVAKFHLCQLPHAGERLNIGQELSRRWSAQACSASKQSPSISPARTVKKSAGNV